MFSLRPDNPSVSYDLKGAEVTRAFFASASIMYLWSTCEATAKALGWAKWLNAATRLYSREAGPFM